MKNVSQYIPAVRPSGAPYSKGSIYGKGPAAKSAPMLGYFADENGNPLPVDKNGLVTVSDAGVGEVDATTGFGDHTIVIEGMPHYGRVFIDSNDAMMGRWGDAAMTMWIVPVAAGLRNVVVVAPNGERRSASINTRRGVSGGPGRPTIFPPAVIRWDRMKALPPVAPSLGGYGKTSGAFTAPSGLAAAQIVDLQGALYALNHAPATAITGRMPVGTAAQLRSFQTNYNAEQAARGHRYSPRTLTVDGDWGPNTQQALANYIPWARTVLMQRGVLPGTVYSQNAPGVSMAPLGGQVTSTTPAKTAQIGAVPTINPITGGPLEKQSSPGASPAAPQTSMAPIGPAPVIPPAASTFPVGPAIAVGVGVLAIAGALVYRSRRNKKGR